MHHGHVAQQRNREDLRQQVSAQQVSVELMFGELRAPDKDLGRQPVVLGVAGEEDGIVSCWDLLELHRKDDEVGQAMGLSVLTNVEGIQIWVSLDQPPLVTCVFASS